MGSNPVLSAKQSANFFSRRRGVADEAHFAGSFAQKTTTMRRTNRLKFRSIQARAACFLQAMIVEWWFPMHLDKTVAHL